MSPRPRGVRGCPSGLHCPSAFRPTMLLPEHCTRLAPSDPSPGVPMQVTLTVTAGPHAGKHFTFDGHDSFLVGRSKDAHFQLSYDDPYFSRRHFLIEVNPPRCRLLDLGSRNGTHVNGLRVQTA